MKGKELTRLFFTEGLIISAISSFVGVVTGALIVTYLSKVGLNFAEAMQGVDMEVSSMLYPSVLSLDDDLRLLLFGGHQQRGNIHTEQKSGQNRNSRCSQIHIKETTMKQRILLSVILCAVLSLPLSAMSAEQIIEEMDRVETFRTSSSTEESSRMTVSVRK